MKVKEKRKGSLPGTNFKLKCSNLMVFKTVRPKYALYILFDFFHCGYQPVFRMVQDLIALMQCVTVQTVTVCQVVIVLLQVTQLGL